MSFDYDAGVCDLCGSRQASSLIKIDTGRAMGSDRRIVQSDIHKLRCDRCGLVRHGEVLGSLETWYTEDYTLNTHEEDHYFFTPNGAISRSAYLCDWITGSMGAHHWQDADRVLEIGAGSGRLLEEMMQRFPDTQFEGIELSKAAARQAQEKNLDVRAIEIEDVTFDAYDIIFSVAVLEHMPSPTRFINELYEHLKPNGLLCLALPTQDVPSYRNFS